MSAFWRDRTVLVTGATGLLGNWLVRALIDREADVTCVVRDWVPQSELIRTTLLDRLRVVRGDICDYSLMNRAIAEGEIQTVFHLAAQTIVGVANRNPISTFQSNIAGTWTVLEACRNNSIVDSVVVASSDKAYGRSSDRAYTEDSPLEGRHPYDVSKSCADLIAQTYGHTYNLPVAIARCGNLFGGGDLNWNRIIPGTIRSILRGLRPVIRSDGNSIRDYFYVEDGAAAYLLLAEAVQKDDSLRGQAFNFSSERPVSVRDLVNRISRLMNFPEPPEIRNDAPNEIAQQFLSTERARNLLGWRPAFAFEDALQLTIDWYRELFWSSADEFSGRELETVDSQAGL